MSQSFTPRPSLLPLTLLALALVVGAGCSKSGDAAGGSAPKSEEPASQEPASEEAGATLQSDLLGVYEVTRYQQSERDCTVMSDIEGSPSHVAFFPFEPADGTRTRLGGTFCGDANLCRAIAKRASEPPIGYSFLSGSDAEGWQGWAILETGSLEGKCSAAVQSHRLRSIGPDAIQVETTTVDVYFLPTSEDESVATCSNKSAIGAASKAKGCKSRLVLEAKRTTQ